MIAMKNGLGVFISSFDDEPIVDCLISQNSRLHMLWDFEAIEIQRLCKEAFNQMGQSVIRYNTLGLANTLPLEIFCAIDSFYLAHRYWHPQEPSFERKVQIFSERFGMGLLSRMLRENAAMCFEVNGTMAYFLSKHLCMDVYVLGGSVLADSEMFAHAWGLLASKGRYYFVDAFSVCSLNGVAYPAICEVQLPQLQYMLQCGQFHGFPQVLAFENLITGEYIHLGFAK